MDTIFYIIVAAAAIAVAATINILKKKQFNKKLIEKIKSQWGQKPSKKYKDGDMKAIAGYYDNIRENEQGSFFIDDITWNDLDMDTIYKRLNNTQSTVGEEYLYSLIREPVTDSSQLNERSRLIEFFQSHPNERLRLQTFLAKLGKSRHVGIPDYFFSNEKYKPFRRNKYMLQISLLALSPLAFLINLSAGILLIIAGFFINMTTYYKARSELSSQLDSMSYLVNLIFYSRKISDIKLPGLEAYTEKLRETASKIKGFGFKSFYQIFYQTANEFLEYFKIIFLVELIAYESISKKITSHRSELREIYETVGLLDSTLAIASFRESVPFYTIPEMFKAGSGLKPMIEFENIYHPLIDDPVTNSAGINKPTLITGSNATGKSTFLKTAAINAIFAQTISTCLAKRYKSSFFLIYTSMALKDDLSSNESYYIAEIKSLKRILQNLNDEYPLLCVIDEVLRGTNTIERIAASSEVMRYLSGKNCICITATHDIELTSILKGLFDNYHFKESFENNKIVFDYKIYPGKSRTRNAIRLLEFMGYPEDTVKAARDKAERFEQKGSWE